MKERSTKDEDRAHRARCWTEGSLSGKNWIEDLTGVPRAGESEQLSLRLPKQLLKVIRALAHRRGIRYQILLKDWLDDRARLEAERELNRAKPLHDRASILILQPARNLGPAAEDLIEVEGDRCHRKVAAA